MLAAAIGIAVGSLTSAAAWAGAIPAGALEEVTVTATLTADRYLGVGQ